MEVIARLQDQELRASIICIIRGNRPVTRSAVPGACRAVASVCV